MDSTSRPTLVLKRNEEQRIRRGHLWVFSNEIDTKTSPLNSFEAGEEVVIMSSQGRPIGRGYINPHSLICARILTNDVDEKIDSEFFKKSFKRALQTREMLFKDPYYRLVFGEGDFLPGLILDRFGDILVGQITTAGMEKLKPLITQTLVELFSPKGILWKNNTAIRSLENLEFYEEIAHGEIPDEIIIREGLPQFIVPLKAGQKTGWFFDQRENRRLFTQYAQDAKVLDVFSYIGSIGINTACAGAKDVLCVDSSEFALNGVKKNAELNNVSSLVRTMVGEAENVMEELYSRSERFNLISLDPPAFIKKKKDLEAGRRKYQKVASRGLKLLVDGGILMFCSCSYHMSRNDLLFALAKAAEECNMKIQVLAQGHQAPDHPIHPMMPETEYLKGFVVRAFRN